MAKDERLLTGSDREPRGQTAALPWRFAPDGAIEVLLITSRETRRWVIPKGWPIKGLSRSAAAAREAFEEAGVVGVLQKPKLGVYRYDKRLRSGQVQRVRVTVYPLRVEQELEQWPEVLERDKLWTSAAEAADLVEEPELKAMLLTFGQAVADSLS